MKFTLLMLLSSALILSGCKERASTSLNAAAAVTEPETAIDSTAPVSFWVATDTHYLDKALEDGGQAFQTYVTGGDGKMLPYSDELTEALVYDVEQKEPEFLILSGDLTNNGEASSHKELAAKLHRIEAMGTSVYVIPGNHDINNPWADPLTVTSRWLQIILTWRISSRPMRISVTMRRYPGMLTA